jgi:hypothetical protein
MRKWVAIWVVCAGLWGGAAQGQEPSFNPFVQRQLDELKEEPSIREAQEAALRHYNLDTETINGMRTRAGLKSLLPSVGARARFGNSDVNLDSFDFVTFPDQVAARDLASGSNLEIEVSGAWDLSRLVFNPEVLDVSALVTLQEGVIKEVTRLYYARRRLQIDLILSPPSDPAERLSKELRVEELTASLDAATGSLFSRRGEE